MGSEPLVQLHAKQSFHQIYLYIFLRHAPFHGMILKHELGHSRSINICDNGLCFKIGFLLESPLTHSFGPCILASEKIRVCGFDDFCVGLFFVVLVDLGSFAFIHFTFLKQHGLQSFHGSSMS
jgi:hypothetical protein